MSQEEKSEQVIEENKQTEELKVLPLIIKKAIFSKVEISNEDTSDMAVEDIKKNEAL